MLSSCKPEVAPFSNYLITSIQAAFGLLEGIILPFGMEEVTTKDPVIKGKLCNLLHPTQMCFFLILTGFGLCCFELIINKGPGHKRFKRLTVVSFVEKYDRSFHEWFNFESWAEKPANFRPFTITEKTKRVRKITVYTGTNIGAKMDCIMYSEVLPLREMYETWRGIMTSDTVIEEMEEYLLGPPPPICSTTGNCRQLIFAFFLLKAHAGSQSGPPDQASVSKTPKIRIPPKQSVLTSFFKVSIN